MRIYLESPEVTLYQGDCLNVLRSLPDDSVNLMLTDPPYHTTKKANVTGDRDFKTDKSYLDWLDTIAEQKYLRLQ
ncbi:MAG: hypothetical protein V7K90_31410 [Nostoc sp.]|uniref:hypothetical protein n=1 Tax=Nostoc sp. TaxID=1180 RepID=UPI002FF8E686